MPRAKVQLMFGNGGGGHKASATAVQKVLLASPAAHLLDVSLVDASAISGAGVGDWLYNLLLSYNAVSAIEVLHNTLHSVVLPIAQPTLRQAFRNHFANTPDLAAVISFIPILNAIMADAMPSHTRFFTVLTDFSHTSSHPWIQHPRQHIIAGTDLAVAQALSMGYVLPDAHSPAMRVSPTSGMVVHPRFYNYIPPAARRRKRRELALPPNLPTVLILFGANAPTDTVLGLVDLFLARPAPAQVNVIAVCGRNKGLFHRLSRRKLERKERRLFVAGFTNQIPLFMQLADVLVGKPGPGVVSEAFVSGLPCILMTGASETQVMKQEKDVLDWVRREQIGLVARSSREAANVTQARIDDMRKHLLSKPPNRAVFEVRDLVLSSLGLPVPDPLDDPQPHQSQATDTEMNSDSSDSTNRSPSSTYQTAPTAERCASIPQSPPQSPREIDLGDLDIHLTPSRKPIASTDVVPDLPTRDTRGMHSR